jgi:predicted nucleic acid-binding protein
VTRHLLDTNIISNATKTRPSEALLAWLGEQADESLFISTLSLAEIWRGILDLAPGRKRRALRRGSSVRRARGRCSPGVSSPSTSLRRWFGEGSWPKGGPADSLAVPST